MKIYIPIKTVSEANVRVHWAVRARRAKAQRLATCCAVSLRLGDCKPSSLFHITRIAPRELDSDNLAGALKAVQDGIADALRINDRNLFVMRSQRKGKPKEYAIEISTEHKASR